MFVVRTFILCVLTATAAGCGGSRRDPAMPIELAVRDRANAHVTLASDGDRIAAAWAATGTSGTDIFLAVSRDGGRTFGPHARVNDIDGDARVNGEQPPQVALRGSDVSVIWTARRDGTTALRTAASADGGMTFGAARTISPPASAGARGWESAAVADDGTVHAVWLDGRNAAPSRTPHVHGAPREPGDAPRQDIYHAMWRGPAAPIETSIAANVCFCCKTAVATRGRDIYVAWRHLFDGGVRDIAFARSSDGGRTFSVPVRVSADDWRIDACPDDGPSMAIDDRGGLHLVWPTLVDDGSGPRLGIFETVSLDGGRTFAPRARVDAAAGAPAHPRVAARAGGRIARVWDELAAGSRRVMYRVGPGPAMALSRGRSGSYPSVVASGDEFVVAWTDQSGSQAVIQVARAR